MVLFRPPDTETQRMVTMVRMTMSATTHDGAETQMEAQRMEGDTSALVPNETKKQQTVAFLDNIAFIIFCCDCWQLVIALIANSNNLLDPGGD